jgi:xanthine dehydrogenase accessory factor
MSRFVRDYVLKAEELSRQGQVFVTVTLVQPEGHVPQDIGAKAIIGQDGLIWGTIGGGRLEARAIDHAKDMIAKAMMPSGANLPPPILVRYDLQQDLGMVCGGAASIFYELSAARAWNIAVFGAGHVAQAVVPLLSGFEANIWCIDHREEWLAKLPVRSNLQKVLVPDLPDYVWKLPDQVFYLCITQGHATDLPVVRQILKRGNAEFLGVIGSMPKSRTLRATLLQEGFTEEQVASIHCPVGLPIGTNAPSEIAVSIAAQLLQKRDEKY